mgnify:FL=1
MDCFFLKKTIKRILFMFFVDVYRQLVGLIWQYVMISLFYGYS